MKTKTIKKSIIFLITITVIGFITLANQAINESEKLKEMSRNNPHELPDLEYEYDALEPYIDAKTMKIHHSKHHQAYVNNLNSAITGTELENMALEKIFENMSAHSASVRNNGGGHYNHALFWKVLSPDGGSMPGKTFLDVLESRFGSFDDFKNKFNTAAATRFGSGWAWLIVDDEGQLQITSTPNQDNPLMDVVEKQGTPILGLDVWEHAYYLKYQNRRADYIGAFWNVVNWPEVEKRYREVVNNY